MRRSAKHLDVLPDSDRRELADNNYSDRAKVILLTLFPLSCPTILSPITILFIRGYHSSWASPSGVMLLGGRDSPTTSERILEDATSVSGFTLEYDL